jgi:hypothetical protein
MTKEEMVAGLVASKLRTLRLEKVEIRNTREGYALLLEQLDNYWDEVRSTHPFSETRIGILTKLLALGVILLEGESALDYRARSILGEGPSEIEELRRQNGVMQDLLYRARDERLDQAEIDAVMPE